MKRPAIFVDKDGTLVENVPYNVDPGLLQFKPGAVQAMAALAAHGFDVIVVTNQSGVARGYFSQAQLLALGEALARRLADEAGVHLKGFVFCPHAPSPDGLPLCVCRKPMPGMLHAASARHGIDLQRSWMIGDTLDDVQAGRRAGCKTILYESGGETLWRGGAERRPWGRSADWAQIVPMILKHEAGQIAAVMGRARDSAPTSAGTAWWR